MVYMKSLRPRSTKEELISALKRAVRAMRGTATKMSRRNVAIQAARYVPENKPVLLKILKAMSDEDYEAFIAPQTLVGEEYAALPSRATKPVRFGDWALERTAVCSSIRPRSTALRKTED